jgi:hypothetical protein
MSRFKNHLIVTAVLSVLAVIFSRIAVAAGPQVTLASSVGGTVIVSGTGFPANSIVIVWVDTNGNGMLDLEEPAVSGVAEGDGSFCPLPPNANGNESCKTPWIQNVPAGSYSILAGNCRNSFPGSCVGTTNLLSAPTALTILFSTLASPSGSHFGSGTHPNVTGYHFPANININVWYDNQPNGQLAAGDTSVTAATDQNGAFSTGSKLQLSKFQVSGAPGDYYVHAGPSTTPLFTAPIHIDSCWSVDGCFIDGVNTICILGNSPTDFWGIFSDCKGVDFNYTFPTPKTPGGGYDLTNNGAVFPGAGLLAAAANSFPPGVAVPGAASPPRSAHTGLHCHPDHIGGSQGRIWIQRSQ